VRGTAHGRGHRHAAGDEGIEHHRGLAKLSDQAGIGIRQTGPVQMPMVLFDDDADNAKGRRFCAATLRAGAYFHPRHNMFLSAAHQPEDIDKALSAAAAGFEALAG